MAYDKLWLLPLEPLEERYSSQWYKWFPREFEKAGYDVEVIDGERLTDKITEGVFLDTCSSYYWEYTQLKAMTRLIKEGIVKEHHTVFGMDSEFPGNLASLKMLLKKRGMKTKVFGFQHAGSYTKGDFVEPLAPEMKYRELFWLMALDGVFVGSKYHKQQILNERVYKYATGVDSAEMTDKIYVSGNPWYPDEVSKSVTWAMHKDVDVIITNPPQLRKNTHITLTLAAVLKSEYNTKLRVVVTTSRSDYYHADDGWIGSFAKTLGDAGVIEIKRALPKDKYYYWLSRSKVMLTNSPEENFGYCPVEAMTFDCVPIMPNHCSYPELVDGNPHLLYDPKRIDDAVDKVIKVLENREIVVGYPKKWEQSIPKMVEVMQST